MLNQLFDRPEKDENKEILEKEGKVNRRYKAIGQQSVNDTGNQYRNKRCDVSEQPAIELLQPEIPDKQYSKQWQQDHIQWPDDMKQLKIDGVDSDDQGKRPELPGACIFRCWSIQYSHTATGYSMRKG